ncbi:putative DNA polymerase III subunit chi [Candidatus Ichthyocystis hellenicum]|uniref:Putative DNA polymerase III subunit chi n=1 Tax=Candidatus Ichthyocystis hellenicum TaxID=1561003 RepID=A0A0S4M7J2_9BURK|nr:DNA polymerase III subunit chi [Candidatus Ichthyocystis hellenicum]CUT18104.1 putative DNA polymerase III subunit chi [Candidatus Ichthyocystis hellenicum]
MQKNVEIFFYFNSNRKLHSACSIVNDHYLRSPRKRMLIFCEDESSSVEMDHILWHFQKITFVPHAIYGTGVSQYTPIVIVHQITDVFEEEAVVVNLLVNKQLCNWNKASKIIEIVSSTDEHEKNMARQRFRTYRSQCPIINSVDLSKK